MKPLRIVMNAFGPFAGEEIVDFSEIEGAGLLLIHGPTGSGKTTILDAMCFALFGDTSGAEREGKQMRCDSAALDLPTLVRYEFALGERRYCVERRPEQERPSKRGSGMTTDSHQATLWESTARGGKGGSGKVLASGAAKVKKAVSELFGFDSDQFRQVVMLPQGQFRKLLSAESKEKEKILQRLFQTSHYARLERALADKASKLRRAFENDQVAMETLLGQEEVESAEALALRIKAASEKHSVAKGELPKHKKGSEAATAAWVQGKSDNALLDQCKEASEAVASLKSKEKEIASLRAQCQQAKRALPLIPRADAATARAEEAKRSNAALAKAQSQLAEDKETQTQAVEALKKEEGRSKERSLATKEEAALDAMAESVERLDAARAASEALESRLQKQTSKIESAAAALEKLTLALESSRTRLSKDEISAAQVEAQTLSLAQNQAAREKREGLDRAHSELAKSSTQHKESQVALVEAQKKVEREEQGLADLELRWQRGQAGALARGISEGDACPVCGSEEHPDLASAPEALPSEPEIEAARSALRDARAAMASSQEKESAARASWSSDQARQESLSEELEASATRELKAWDLQLAEQSAGLAKAKSAEERVRSGSAEVQAAQEALATAKTEQEERTGALASGRIEAASLSGSVQELESKVPPDLRPPGSLAIAKAKATTKSEMLASALQTAQAAAGVASQKFAASEARSVAAKESASDAGAKASEASKEFDVHCGHAGFEDLASFQKAKEGSSKIADWESQLKKHEGEVQAAADRLQRSQEAADGKSSANLEELASLAEAARAALELAIRGETEAKNLLERLQKTLADHEAIRKRVAKQEEQWRVVASVSDLANGKVPPKVSFQRFVLGALLDEVLLAASVRLSHMSKGRYALERQTEARHKGKASGLELEVLDAYTGSARSVATLSGGESFLAALSLSLGLADVVQGFSGGIRLDTLLIDEGFGTLDADALDLAMDTLTELRAEGRLVGIISHVEELKTRIPTRLEVLRGEAGSTTRFVGE